MGESKAHPFFMQITLPDYLTIKHYNQLKYLADIESETDKILYQISVITGIAMEELETYPLPAIQQIYKEINELLVNINPEFYPVIKWQGKLYGFKSINKMSMAEYTDLSNLCKNPAQNLTNILALLYRPIIDNKLNSTKYITKSTIKALQYEVENVFDYYEIEKYDAVTRKQRADEYLEFPAEIGLGALNFFMLLELSLSKNTQSYFPSLKQMIMKMKMSKLKSALVSTMAGFTLSTKWLKPKSYQ